MSNSRLSGQRADPVDAPAADEVEGDGRDPCAHRHRDDDPEESESPVTHGDSSEDRIRFLEDDARGAERGVLPQALEQRNVLHLLDRRRSSLKYER